MSDANAATTTLQPREAAAKLREMLTARGVADVLDDDRLAWPVDDEAWVVMWHVQVALTDPAHSAESVRALDDLPSGRAALDAAADAAREVLRSV